MVTYVISHNHLRIDNKILALAGRYFTNIQIATNTIFFQGNEMLFDVSPLK